MTFASWGATAFDVQYWNGTSWATVPNGSVTGNNKVWRQFTFANITTSKIRVTVNSMVDNAYSRIVEVEAWTPASATNYALPANGGSATASSYLGAPYNFYPSYVNDGQRTSANSNIWLDNTYQSFPDWVQIDFNGTKTINEIDVVTQQDSTSPVEPTLNMTFASWGATAFDVQYWNGTSWATVPNGSVTGNNKVWRQFTFANITTSKIRVTVNNMVDNAYSRVVEVEAWGEATGGSSAKINWLVPDHLGTPRIILDQTGSSANVKRHDYLPFGEELPAGAGGRTTAMGYAAGDNVRQQFTSKERDSETGLDYFINRYYSAAQGRFTSIDPQNAEALSNLTDPQGWNAYSYVKNSPCSNTDPDGRCICLWQRLKNAAYHFRSDEEVQALEDKWRNYLREMQKKYGRELVWVGAPGTGTVIVDPEKLSRDEVFKYARLFRDAEHDNRLRLFSEEDMQKIREAHGMGQPPPVPVLSTWQNVAPSRPLDKMGHAKKHLGDFQKIDPNLTEGDVAKILEHVRKVGQSSPAQFGGKAFEASVDIAGKPVTVKVIESSAGLIKTGYPVP